MNSWKQTKFIPTRRLKDVLSLRVKCMNGPCSWEGELRGKQEHLTRCDHEVITCVFDGCDTRLARVSIERHEEACE
ncbi:TNF receptor-associated factor 6 [Nematostella vectensis]|uniref:TNF receptor-associated factor 6 n=1 Tax=Nematostella vectensis TaxID=45351 RepID=UPI00138FBCE3|nr:TNF receptor-associated factor 6 [Nematostella vectensis]XP_048584272.1 TNF receptor-associated factor 6 [Nematostella vectensis]